MHAHSYTVRLIFCLKRRFNFNTIKVQLNIMMLSLHYEKIVNTSSLFCTAEVRENQNMIVWFYKMP